MVAAVPSSALAIPASLHASLMARLDQLGVAKEVAQIGAVSGQSSLMLYWPPWPAKEAELNSSLDRLVAAGLLLGKAYRHSEQARRRNRYLRNPKGRRVLENARDAFPRRGVGVSWQCFGRSSEDHLRRSTLTDQSNTNYMPEYLSYLANAHAQASTQNC